MKIGNWKNNDFNPFQQPEKRFSFGKILESNMLEHKNM
jgi:hypothetical protein